jgi:hypothetical protein
METSPLIHEESSDIAQQLGAAAQASGMNMIYDVTLGSVSTGERYLGGLHDNNYKVGMAYVSTSVPAAIESAMGRYERGVADYANGKGEGGRLVPPSYIASSVEGAGDYRSKNEGAFHDLIGRPAGRTTPDWYVKIDNEPNAHGVRPRRLVLDSRAKP